MRHGPPLLTKENVASGIVLPAAVMIFVWPELTYYVVAAFYVTTFGMLLADWPRGELLAPANVDEDRPKWVYWTLQPRWVEGITLWIAFPAWLLFIREVAGPFEPVDPVPFIAIGATAVLQMVFIARAYWRMEI